MKQHIDIEQLKQIPKDKVKLLFNDYEEQIQNLTLFGGIVEEEWLQHFSEQLNIGKMIEILGKPICITTNSNKDSIYAVWIDIHDKRFDSLELCNCLYEAVKFILKYK